MGPILRGMDIEFPTRSSRQRQFAGMDIGMFKRGCNGQ